MSAQSGILDRETIRTDIARLLEIEADELDPALSLVDQGLDSVRLMALVEQWRGAGADVDFVSLATEPRLEAWYDLLAPR
ncbi:phosphopantetheine-binding protein [Rhodococcus aetherivorans]|uniref:phosphopantetheine-binding protein n=1 Tax=Rhodococcus TaxID=1827 RepID=UPI0002D22DDE|nr:MULTISPECIES: phosphopantetheine-binding protein [Rhodococcus]OLL20713.1 isochorismatase [Rhodococcus sp. M8]QPG44562.1 isochorismatase [Rhodococcus sp. M8]QRI75898.1 isochorismatase [Rhodococcus aetherivorans]QSE59310.1 isochorismatase [Rhodococcus sp. PSBB066]QSE69366.1 isochorismatase [Rhodococcus sp. PSBB049]